jgi:transcription elongation GreA/GreB family factor
MPPFAGSNPAAPASHLIRSRPTQEPSDEHGIPPGQRRGTPRVEATEIAELKRDLRYWQTRQITAEVAPPPSGDTVEFGCRVAILLNGKPRTYRIVGDDEADPATGSISFAAPLSRALLGAEVGEVLPFGAVDDAIRVVEIATT